MDKGIENRSYHIFKMGDNSAVRVGVDEIQFNDVAVKDEEKFNFLSSKIES